MLLCFFTINWISDPSVDCLLDCLNVVLPEIRMYEGRRLMTVRKKDDKVADGFFTISNVHAYCLHDIFKSVTCFRAAFFMHFFIFFVFHESPCFVSFYPIPALSVCRLISHEQKF